MSTPWPSTPPPARTGAPSWALVLIALVTALVLIVGVFIVLTLTGGTASANEVTREPVNTAGANPFMPAVGTDAQQVAPVSAGGSFRGDTPGLYGGTRDDRTCDAAKLTGFLSSHPSQAAAWAGVLGIRASEIDRYVSTLTPVLLRSDTWVTNHGYSDGRATVVSSVLQAGSAVFVDKYGSPVVRCACGNPLTAPTLLTSPVYTGPTWVSFNQTNITIVQNTTTIVNNYTLVDPWRNQPFVRYGGYRPGWQPTEPDGDHTGGPLPVPDTQNPNNPTDPGQSGPGSLPKPFDPQDAKCPDGTWVRSGGKVQGVSTADLNGDGQKETAVLVKCGDQQQVSVYANDGTVVDTLPTPTPPPGSSRTPRYDPVAGFQLTKTALTIGIDVYGPDDTTNPTVNQVWRWDWSGSSFTLRPDSVAPVEASAPAAIAPVQPVQPAPPIVDDQLTVPAPESAESSSSGSARSSSPTSSAESGG